MSPIPRRRFLISVGALLAAPCSFAQPAKSVYRVGAILTASPVAEMAGADPVHPLMNGLVRELRVLGYVEGGNLILERRSSEGNPQRYPDLVAELVELKADVIVTAGGGPLFTRAKKVWGNVPIVMFGGDDPVPYGLAASLGRPGGNLTGLLAITGPENEAKRLELLKEAVPTLSRVGYLGTKTVWDLPLARAVREAASAMHVELLYAEHKPDDLEATFAAIEHMRLDALFVSVGPESFGQHRQIVQFALKARLPGSYPFPPMVEAGGLMSYGVSIHGLGRRAAHYVDKILRGAKPGDLPIEGPSKFELVINLKTAKELGIAIPQSLLQRVDRVVE